MSLNAAPHVHVNEGLLADFFVPTNNAINALSTDRSYPLYPTMSSWWLLLLLARLGFCAQQLTGILSAAEDDIQYIPKEQNPPARRWRHCVPLNIIEYHWLAPKKAIDEGGWEATSFDFLRRQIQLMARKILIKTIIKLFCTVKESMRLCAEIGCWAMCH